MYTTINFKHKNALIREVKAGAKLTIFQPGPYGKNIPKEGPKNGTVFLEGPHYPAAHTWYAKAEMKDGFIVSVK